MRISTADLFGGGLAQMQRLQSELANSQQQLSSGKRITTAADDPGGAVEAMNYGSRITQVDQYARNADFGTNRLQQEETALQQMDTNLQRVRELAVQAANGTQTDESRAAIASELRQISSNLVDTANTKDASGEYLFAGFRSANRPFLRNASGGVDYVGDGGQRQVALSPSRKIAVNDSGDALMTIPRGNGVFAVTPAAGNTGTGSVASADVTDPSAVGNATYTIRMVAADTYAVQDSSGATIATGAYTADQPIDIGGRRIVLSGRPAAGDSFAVGPAGTASLFSVVDDLATALETPRPTAADRTALSQSTSAALQNIDQALGRVTGLRTAVGARLDAIDAQGTANSDNKVQLQSALSNVQDLDYASAISRFQLQQTALQAAQQTYVQLGHMSLFDYIR